MNKGLEIETDDEEYETSRLYQSKFQTYGSSVIKDRSFANGHFKQNNEAPNDSYRFNLKGLDMIKAVADEGGHLGLTNKKELAICLALDYIASTIVLTIDYATKFSRIANPKWVTNMYIIYSQDATVKDYLRPHVMDGCMKREDYLYLTTGYLQYDKKLACSGNNSSDEDSSYEEYNYGHPLTQ